MSLWWAFVHLSIYKGVKLGTFFERLIELRKATGLNQTEFGVLGGVTKKTQLNYEAGIRSPDVHYLEALYTAGIDVVYLLTGMRTLKISEEQAGYEIRPDQKALLDNYEHCSEEGRRMVMGTALSGAKHHDDLAQPKEAVKAAKKRA